MKDGSIITTQIDNLPENSLWDETSQFYKRLRKDEVRVVQIACNNCKVKVGIRVKSGTLKAIDLVGKDCLDMRQVRIREDKVDLNKLIPMCSSF